jgi:cyclophilin family peptidyl-prolyl cis-trans isomerase
VFGEVVTGKEVADKIKAVPNATRGHYENVPQEPVTITRATVVQQ